MYSGNTHLHPPSPTYTHTHLHSPAPTYTPTYTHTPTHTPTLTPTPHTCSVVRGQSHKAVPSPSSVSEAILNTHPT